MSPLLIGILGTVLMVAVLLLGLPIGFSMLGIGFLGIALLKGLGVALPELHLVFYSIVSTYTFTVIPLFILMGNFAGASGMSSDLYNCAEKWLRKLPGGLALATIAGCAGFSSICGSSVGTAAAMGTVSLPEMRKYGYDPGLATGTIAAGGTLGFLIPPSVAFVVYGIITEQSIGKLLMAGFLPGITLALAFMAIIIVRVKLNPALAPENKEQITWKERFTSLRSIWGVIIVFVLVMGGIYLGWFTSTEAAGVGAFVLFIFSLAKKKLSWRVLHETMVETAGVTAMVFVIIYGAFVFSDFLALSRAPFELMQAIGALDLSRWLIFALIIIMYLILGCFIESIPMIILTMPVLMPVLTGLKFDLIWFGVIAVLMVEAALITPPVGMNVYVISGVAKDVPMVTIFKGAMPFVIAILVVVIVLAIFPDIALFLPSMMKK